MRSVCIAGSFVAFAFSQMRPAPAGTTWAINGVYIEPVSDQDVTEDTRLSDEDIVLQVCLHSVTKPGDRESCVYLLKRMALRLLHIPPHVFAVLAAHRWHHHCDRHFATHCASFRRSHNWCERPSPGSGLVAIRHPGPTITCASMLPICRAQPRACQRTSHLW